MKYTVETEIPLPRDKVVALFDDPRNLPKWQPELVRFEHVSGEPGQPGAKSRLTYRMGKREMDMLETIIRRNLPDELAVTLETKGMWNETVHRFSEAGPATTRWTSENEFRFRGFMKVMALAMPSAFKNQSLKFMRQFKEFAEKDTATSPDGET